MSTVRSPLFLINLLLVVLGSLIGDVQGAPQRNRGNGRNRNTGNTGNTNSQTGQQQQQGVQISQATDGSTILDATANVNGVPLRFKVSAPSTEFTTASPIPGAAQAPNTAGTLGLNVLLHGDGGQSFFDFPNQAVQANQMGVVILAPSEQLLWGQRTGPPQGLTRDDGVADAQAVRDFIQTVLPQVVAFDPGNVFFTGVSGGSLLLSGFFMPAHLAEFAAAAGNGNGGAGVLLMCGALEPQVDVVNASAFIGNTRIHFQSTQDELVSLREALPASIVAYEALAEGEGGLDAGEIGVLQTVDNSPRGGHCEFDELGFVSGIQLVADNFANIMLGGDGSIVGFDAATVLNPVVGNEELVFGGV